MAVFRRATSVVGAAGSGLARGTHDATRSTEVSWQEPPSGSSAVDGASHVALPPAGTLATDEMALPTTVPAASTTFSPMK